MDEQRGLEHSSNRGQNVDPENTYSTQNRGATMRPPRAEERAPKRENQPETTETCADDTDNRTERQEDTSHRPVGSDAQPPDPAIRNEKQLVADSKSQTPDEVHGETFERTGDPAGKDRHA